MIEELKRICNRYEKNLNIFPTIIDYDMVGMTEEEKGKYSTPILKLRESIFDKISK